MSPLSPDLSLIPPSLHAPALADWESGDVTAFLGKASNELSVSIVLLNAVALQKRGLLERAFVDAMVATRTNNYRFYSAIASLAVSLDRERLLAAGDPLPLGSPWTVYRGVAGRGPARRVRGFSWSTDLDIARWFARRGGEYGLADPGVYSARVTVENVLFFSSNRTEAEFLLDVTSRFKVNRIE